MAKSLKVLLVGSGGREHALAWRLRHEDPSTQIFAAPGNPGIGQLATCTSVTASDLHALLAMAQQKRVDFTLIGPEAPLAAGIADAFRAANLPVFGPTRAAAMLESSKAFSKTLMEEARVPTARAFVCSSLDDAKRAIAELGAPVVIKASGLAAGKGVIIAHDAANATRAAESMFEGSFGDAGNTVLVEEFMEGEELSLFVLTDGTRAIPLPAAQDHKRLLNDDEGPNTGGMGAYSPVSFAEQSPNLVNDVLDRIVTPTLSAMRARGTPFAGLLYVGLMITKDGPKVVEFNCRFGDPETQAVLPAIDPKASVTELMRLIAVGDALPQSVGLRATRVALTTVIAAPGYPDQPRTGDVITLPAEPDGVLVFHAGTKRPQPGTLVAAGGRVLAVTGVAPTLEQARRLSLDYANSVDFADKQFRTDIGWRELKRHAGAPGN